MLLVRPFKHYRFRLLGRGLGHYLYGSGYHELQIGPYVLYVPHSRTKPPFSAGTCGAQVTRDCYWRSTLGWSRRA